MNNNSKDFLCFDAYVTMKNTRKLVEEKLSRMRQIADLKCIDVFILYYIYIVDVKKEYAINHGESSVKSTDICEALKYNKGQVSTALDHLVQIGYLTTSASVKDKRITYYELTEKGKQLTIHMDEKIASVNEKINSQLTEDEIKAFNKVITTYIECIDNLLD